MEQESKQITTIPATISRYSQIPLNGKIKRKAAGYARVSTDKDEQFSSYAAQVEYYTRYIKSRDDLSFVAVYTDEGITGTSTKKRKGFIRMIKDALNGKIDLIVTKSISRFARNTVDSLVTIRKLKEHGVEVFFEKENIYTLDSKGELLITIMSSLAQEESRSISENVLWGINNSAKNGKVHVPFGEFVGYDRGINGELVVNKLQAALIKRIFTMSQENMTCYEIAKELTKEKVPTPQNRSKQWYASTIKSILQNEKYTGDALLRKTFCTDFLTKKRIKNTGQITQYYVSNSHEAIISKDVFNIAKKNVYFRKYDETNRRLGTYLLQGKVYCPSCNRWYGYKTWHCHSNSEKSVWICNGKYKGGKKCDSKIFTDNELIDIINKKLIDYYKYDHDKIIEFYYKKRSNLFNNKYFELEVKDIDNEASILKEQIDNSNNNIEKRKLKIYYYGILHRKVDLNHIIRYNQKALRNVEMFLFANNNHSDNDIILFMWKYFFDYIEVFKSPILNDPYRIIIQ